MFRRVRINYSVKKCVCHKRKSAKTESEKICTKYWSITSPRTAWALHSDVYVKMCKSDIMYRLLFEVESVGEKEKQDEYLFCHINGLVSTSRNHERGIIINTFGEDDWSSNILDTFKMISGMPTHSVLGQPEHRDFVATFITQ